MAAVIGIFANLQGFFYETYIRTLKFREKLFPVVIKNSWLFLYSMVNLLLRQTQSVTPLFCLILSTWKVFICMLVLFLTNAQGSFKAMRLCCVRVCLSSCFWWVVHVRMCLECGIKCFYRFLKLVWQVNICEKGRCFTKM